jgi:hypothetical protein
MRHALGVHDAVVDMCGLDIDLLLLRTVASSVKEDEDTYLFNFRRAASKIKNCTLEVQSNGVAMIERILVDIHHLIDEPHINENITYNNGQHHKVSAVLRAQTYGPRTNSTWEDPVNMYASQLEACSSTNAIKLIMTVFPSTT